MAHAILYYLTHAYISSLPLTPTHMFPELIILFHDSAPFEVIFPLHVNLENVYPFTKTQVSNSTASVKAPLSNYPL